MLAAGLARKLVFGFMVLIPHNFCCDAGVASRLPQLVPDQVLKLKQLTVMTLAETDKVSCHVIVIVCDDALHSLKLSNYVGLI